MADGEWARLKAESPLLLALRTTELAKGYVPFGKLGIARASPPARAGRSPFTGST
jgi:hypothetical protein